MKLLEKEIGRSNFFSKNSLMRMDFFKKQTSKPSLDWKTVSKTMKFLQKVRSTPQGAIKASKHQSKERRITKPISWMGLTTAGRWQHLQLLHLWSYDVERQISPCCIPQMQNPGLYRSCTSKFQIMVQRKMSFRWPYSCLKAWDVDCLAQDSLHLTKP